MDSSPEDRLFGHWLRKRRRALDLTQKRLAALLGCSVATVRKIEREERRPSRGLAAAIARSLGVPEDEMKAFVRFARTGWADTPPTQADRELDRPWARATETRARSERAAPTFHDIQSTMPTQTGGLSAVVGRDQELAHLEGALRSALEGSGNVVLVAGEAGQGKTALIASFAARAQHDHTELLVAAGSCNAFSGLGDPFLPFREALNQLTGAANMAQGPITSIPLIAERLQRFAHEGAAIVLEHGPRLIGTLVDANLLRSTLAAAGDEDKATESGSIDMGHGHLQLASRGVRQEALRSETVEVLARVAQVAPLLLVMDDLQWVDASSVELLLQLASVVPRHRLLVVGAFRPTATVGTNDGQSPWPRSHHELELRFGQVLLDLDRSDGRAFLEAWLDSEPNRLDRSFREALFAQTSGHPLFTIELLRAMQERGDLIKDVEGRWATSSTLRWDVLPTRIAGALSERLDRLDRSTQRVLQVASVEGESFTAEVVAHVLGQHPRAIVQSVAADLHRLVEPIGVERNGKSLVSRYRFRHNLIQRFVYERLDEGQRTYLHEAVADALVELTDGAPDSVALAQHYVEAKAPDRAAPFQRRAGDHSRASGALPEAIRYYRAALQHWDQSDDAGLTELRVALGECLQIRGERDEARVILEQARAGFLRTGNRRRAALAQVGVAPTTGSLSPLSPPAATPLIWCKTSPNVGSAPTSWLRSAGSTASPTTTMPPSPGASARWRSRATCGTRPSRHTP